MSEQQPRQTERHEHAPEHTQERSQLQTEREPINSEKVDAERQERLTEARQTTERESRQSEHHHQPIATESLRITKTDKQRAYQMTVSRIQARLPKTSRTFSRFVHNKQVERASEVLEKTLVRPSGILGGSMAAAFGLTVMLFFAKRNGFTLAGSEFMLLLAVGWLVGVSLEFISRLWRRHHRL